MSRLTFTADVVVRRPIAEVFAYVSDFDRAYEWRPEVVMSHSTPPGPAALGTRWHEIARVAGREVVTDTIVDTYEPLRWLSFAYVAGPLPVSGGFAVEEHDGGTRLTYVLHVELHGTWAAATPLLRRSGRRTLARSMVALRARLEQPAASPSSTVAA